MFALQDRVTQRVVGERGRIRAAGYRDAFGKPSANLAEYDDFMRVHTMIFRFTKEAFEEAQRVAREGVTRFPKSGLLRIKLGCTHLNMVRFEWSADRQRDLSEAHRLASKGLTDPGLPPIGRSHGHWLMAQALVWHERDFERALAKARRPTEPNHLPIAASLTILGRAEEAHATVRRVLDREPTWSVARVALLKRPPRRPSARSRRP